MARNVATVLYNNFAQGFVTEATGLNFPENAVTDSDNVRFKRIGSATRRLGYDLEAGHVFFNDQRSNARGVIKEFTWRAVSLEGGFTMLVVQQGRFVKFFISGPDPLSASQQSFEINLQSFRIAGSPDPRLSPASFSSGMGWLFIAHPSCDTLAVVYNDELDELEVSRIRILIRDWDGLNTTAGPDFEPETLDEVHLYNLKNQGWYRNVRVGSVNNEPAGSGPDGNTPTPPADPVIPWPGWSGPLN